MPTTIRSSPVIAVESVIARRVVVTTRRSVSRRSSSDPALGGMWEATLVDMAERKMRPTSWTWPMAKGREERKEKVTWWMAEPRKTRRERAGMKGRKRLLGNMMATYARVDGTETMVLMIPTTMASDSSCEDV